MKIGLVIIIFLLILGLWLIITDKNNIFRKDNSQLPIASFVDLGKYQGTWYEIARLPNIFEDGCYNAEANYLLKNGKIYVTNTCIKNGNLIRANGIAVPNDTTFIPGTNIIEKAKLKVSFYPPIQGEYNIITITPDYQNAMVGTSDRKYLWILSRNRKMPQNIFLEMVKYAKEIGFDTNRLIINKTNAI